ncbi:MAG TPA: FixH family protein [Verrucomicrobiae bacterium]|nr:FixH family protein [Verrucomicrobiae bacterium]
MTKPSRNLWPASIIGFFVLAIIFLVTFVAWAMRQREGLVSADYYEQEVRYQQQLDSMNRSQSIAAQMVVTFDPMQQVINVALPREQRTGANGVVHLYRPSDARLDREMALAIDENGVQKVDAKTLENGLWKVRVKWNSGGQEYFVDQPVIVTGAPNSDSARG